MSALTVNAQDESCHTYPNDKLLQHKTIRVTDANGKVVIPIQTISFYNKNFKYYGYIKESCHTYPNDKLLQLDSETACIAVLVVIPIQTISFYNRERPDDAQDTLQVVIPIQTISFYNILIK